MNKKTSGTSAGCHPFNLNIYQHQSQNGNSSQFRGLWVGGPHNDCRTRPFISSEWGITLQNKGLWVNRKLLIKTIWRVSDQRKYLVGEAGMQHGVARNFAEVSGGQLPHLRRHAVLLHQRLLRQVYLRNQERFKDLFVCVRVNFPLSGITAGQGKVMKPVCAQEWFTRCQVYLRGKEWFKDTWYICLYVSEWFLCCQGYHTWCAGQGRVWRSVCMRMSWCFRCKVVLRRLVVFNIWTGISVVCPSCTRWICNNSNYQSYNCKSDLWLCRTPEAALYQTGTPYLLLCWARWCRTWCKTGKGPTWSKKGTRPACAHLTTHLKRYNIQEGTRLHGVIGGEGEREAARKEGGKRVIMVMQEGFMSLFRYLQLHKICRRERACTGSSVDKESERPRAKKVGKGFLW